MSSVGYGGIIATTPGGRFNSLLIALIGAFLLSLLVALTTEWFIMEERQTRAINKMSKDRFAVESVRTAF